MATKAKHTPEVPEPIRIVNPTEEEMKFWSAIMALETPDNDSSCPSSVVSSAYDDSPFAMRQDQESTASAGLGFAMLKRQKTSMQPQSQGDFNEETEEMDESVVQKALQKHILEDEGGFVAKSNGNAKEQLPSPTDATNSAIEMGMWALLKRRKRDEKDRQQQTECMCALCW